MLIAMNRNNLRTITSINIKLMSFRRNTLKVSGTLQSVLCEQIALKLIYFAHNTDSVKGILWM